MISERGKKEGVFYIGRNSCNKGRDQDEFVGVVKTRVRVLYCKEWL